MYASRIMGIKDGVLAPVFGPSGTTATSPSPTLPIETHVIPAGECLSHSIVDQMITLFLQPGMVLHTEGNGPTRRIPIAARSMTLSLRGVAERVELSTSVFLTSLTINDQVVSNASQALSRNGRFEILPNPTLYDHRLSALLYTLHLESVSGFPTGRLFIDGLEQSLAALLVTYFNTQASRSLTAPTALPPRLVRQVRDFVHAHLADNVSIDDLVRCTGYSASHITRLFTASFGMAPHQYLLHIRIERAKELITTPNPPSMLDIALQTGFSSAQHFSRVFRKLVGCPPSTYLLHHR